MNETNKGSLKTYVRRYLIGVAVALALVNVLLMYHVYHRGLDDTAELYLYEDGLSLMAGHPVDDAPDSFRRHYVGKAQLPGVYRLPAHVDHLSIHHFDLAGSYDYLLVIQPESTETAQYLVHSFAKDQETLIFKLSIVQVIALSGVVLILTLLASAFLINKVFSQSIDQLSQWAKRLSQSSRRIQPESKPRQLAQFSEINTISQQLDHQINQLKNNQLRERQFIQKLSHELRTPMAITQAAVDLLKTRDDLSPDALKKIHHIEQANQTMITTAATILDMWHDQNQPEEHVSIDWATLLDQAVNDQRRLTGRSDLTWEIAVDAESTQPLPKQIVTTLINNLIENVHQHAAPGPVQINVNNRITITNMVNDQVTETVDWHTPHYRLGTTIVNAICEHQGWQASHRNLGKTFCTEIAFSDFD